MYNENTGYREVVPRKLTSWQLKKHGKERAHEYVMQTGTTPRANQRGTIQDGIKGPWFIPIWTLRPTRWAEHPMCPL